MVRRLLILLCLAAVLSVAKTPRPLIDLPIQTPDRKGISLRKLRGQVVILVIFSTTCEECLNALEFMNKLQKEYGPRGLQVVAASGDENARFALGPFVQRYRPQYPVGFLTKDEIVRIADITPDVRPVAPIIMFIDRLGQVRFQYFGNDQFLQDADKNFRAIVTGLLNSNERHVVTAPTQKQ